MLGCGPSAQPGIKNQPLRAAGSTTLYERLGGESSVYAIADNLIEQTMADPRVNLSRIGHQHQWDATPGHVAELKTYWAQFLGVLADGPQLYEGRNMLDLHRGMQISQPEWDAFIGDLAAVLARSRIRPEDQRDLVSRVAGTHDAIVGQ